MTNETENINSPNDELDGQDEPETISDGNEVVEDMTALKEKLSDMQVKNRQLFERAKKAEGFELKDGKWVKKQPKTEVKDDPVVSVKSGKLDLGQKAYLRAEGIKKDEEDLVLSYMENTGKSLEDVVENKFFQNELKELRDLKATENAIPTQTKRSVVQTQDTVDYWLAKGELPPPDKVQLRRDVLNARVEREKNLDKFTDKPFVGNV